MGSPIKKRPPAVTHFLLSAAGLSLLTVLILGTFALSLTLAGPALRSGQLAAVVSARLVDLTNTDRQSDQLNTLTLNPVLTQAAQAKANDMAKYGYFAHTSPAGVTSWFWFKQAGYSFSYAGENLAVDFTDSDDVNQAWLNSPTHRANILNGDYTEIGIATAQGMFEGHQTTFVVQMFGTPAKPAPITSASEPADPTQIAVARTVPDTQVLGASAQPVAQAPVKKPVPQIQKVAVVAAPVAASAQPVAPAPAIHQSSFSALISSPRALLRNAYIVFALILALALLFRTGFELKRHHLKHVFAVLALFVLMGGLFFVADRLVFVSPIVGTGYSV